MLFVLAFIAGLIGCKMEGKLLTHEEEQIQEFIRLNDITAQPTESGLYYIEVKLGEGPKPIEGDTVGVYYVGKFLSGMTFDSYTLDDYDEPLWFVYGKASLIAGFLEGVSMMHEGGEAELLIPSKLAYGPYGQGYIPGYTPLFFTVVLEAIKPGPGHDEGAGDK